MKEIDIDVWTRKEHFAFFRSMAYPIYNICFDLDVTRARDFSKENTLSFNLVMIHVSMSSLNGIDNFKYRLRGEKVILHDSLTPSYADIQKGSDLFKMITVPFDKEISSFVSKAEEKARQQQSYFVISELAGRDDFVFFSALPWITFTGLDHTINLKGEDAIPRISWGKYYEKEGRILLPYNIQVNHMFVDGFHLGLLKERLDHTIAGLG